MKRLAIAILCICISILLIGCEADRTVSPYEISTLLQSSEGSADLLAIEETEQYSPKETFEAYIAEQPSNYVQDSFLLTWKRQSDVIKLLPQERKLQRTIAYPLLSKLWNLNYTALSRDGFEDLEGISSHLISVLNATQDERLVEYSEAHVKLMTTHIEFLDEYAVQYTDSEGHELLRVQANVLAYCDGDSVYFAEHPELVYGDNFIVVYMYYTRENTTSWSLTAICQCSYAMSGIGYEWYSSSGYVMDTSQIQGLFPFKMLEEYSYRGTLQNLPRTTQKSIAETVARFCNVFYGLGKPTLTGEIDELRTIVSTDLFSSLSDDPCIVEQLQAASNGLVQYINTYHSTLLEMKSLWSTIYVYEKGKKEYYVFSETVPLNVIPSLNENTFGYNIGSWKYELFFIVDMGGSQPIIIDYILVPVEPTSPDALMGDG